jgi:hypothetical protein
MPSFAIAGDSAGPGCDRRTCTFNAFGSSATASWFGTVASGGASDTGGGGGGGGYVFGSISVSRGGSNQNPQTFVSYFVVACDVSSCTNSAGFGTVPNGDFSARGNAMHLNTNTANNSSFITYQGQPGTIAVDWTSNGLFETRVSGTNETTAAGFFREKQTGQSDDQSANASGSVVGFSVSQVTYANISTNHNMTVFISQ